MKQDRTKHAWFCKKCNEDFETSTQLRKHRKLHQKDDDYFPSNNYKWDNNLRIFICCTCDIEMSRKGEMEKHVLEHEDKFICGTCNEQFYKPYEFSCHVFKHNENKGFSCPLCDYSTLRRTAILIHINTFHLHKYKYTCDQCGKGFSNHVLFKEHDNIHLGIKPFSCIVCDKSFVYSSYLLSHQIHNHRVSIDGVVGTNQCYVCRKSFKRLRTLQHHLQTHLSLSEKKAREKNHLCDICGKSFSSTEKLKIHYRVHTGDKPYTCSYCSKSFTKRDYLIMHERVHSGEKPYSCEYCGKCFNQGAPLRLHIRSHTGERPYKCHICQNGFISRGVLNGHLKSCPGIRE